MPNFRINDFRTFCEDRRNHSKFTYNGMNSNGWKQYPNRYSGSMDGIATPREMLFSVLIVGVLFVIGCLIHHCIVKEITDHNLKIQQAIRINDNGQFAHCLSTSPGDAICEGDLDAVNPVQDEKGNIKGEFWKIVREYQVYTMHTRTVHYTTGSGKNLQHHTRIEHYWTWDTHETHIRHCKALRFCGVELPLEKISLDYWSDTHSPVSIGYNKRYVYHTIPKHHHGSVYTTFENRTMKDNSPFYSGMTPEVVAEHLICGNWPVYLFWFLATVVAGFAVYWFCMLNNRWLESKGSDKRGIQIG